MATELLYKASQFWQTTLDVGGGINNSQTTGIILASVSGIDNVNEPGIALFSYSNPLNTSNAEWVAYKYIDGSKELQGVTRGAEGFSAKSHANGVTIAFPLSKSHINNAVNAIRSGWVGVKDTWTYASSTTITVPSGATSIYQIGDKIRLQNNGSGTYLYMTVTNVASTLLTVSGDAVPNATLTDIYYSHAGNPLGAPVTTGLSSKIITATRDLTAASGDVSYTGVGFQPTAIIAFAALGGGTEGQSWGFTDSSAAEQGITRGSNGLGYTAAALCSIEQASGALQSAVLKQYDSLGFTLTWTKTGTPTGTASLFFICFR